MGWVGLTLLVGWIKGVIILYNVLVFEKKRGGGISTVGCPCFYDKRG